MTAAPGILRAPLNAYDRSTTVSEAPRQRIASLDIIRGAVMILMAIDHVRVYAGVPAGGPTAGVFFTRWVTHFSAPVFAFLAGTGAFLLGRKIGRAPLARFLLSRGLFLVLLEMTVLRLAWTFNFDYAHYMLAGVIWMLGWCMVLLAASLPLGPVTIGVTGLVIMAGQSLLHPVASASPAALRWVWQLLFIGGPIELGHGGPPLWVLYNIVPWIGVMMAGYGFGAIMVRDREVRDRMCYRIGLSAIVVFLAVGSILAARNTRFHAPFLFRLLNQAKYRDSQLFLLMTLGPAIALVPLAERMRGIAGRTIGMYGRVPLFFYVLHIPLIHGLACLVSLIRAGAVDPWLFTNHPVAPPDVPAGYMWSLPLLYLVFAVTIALLYVPCRWYAHLKATRRAAWMSYL